MLGAKAVFGPDALFLAGAVAACLVTWFTFLPSFLFILAGGPLVESSHNAIQWTAPLTAITAAVVGVILSLALFFGQQVLWPTGFSGPFDGTSAALAAVLLLTLEGSPLALAVANRSALVEISEGVAVTGKGFAVLADGGVAHLICLLL